VPRLGLLPAPLPPSPAAATLPMSPPHALARRTGENSAPAPHRIHSV